MLALFLARGVDIDAGDRGAKNWMTLHTMASETPFGVCDALMRDILPSAFWLTLTVLVPSKELDA
jgi:hypothetical protein